jgi:hypothetical protein
MVGKPEAETPLERPGYRFMDNIKMDLLEIGLENDELDWSGS